MVGRWAQHSWRTVVWVVVLAAHTVVLLMKAVDVGHSNSNGRGGVAGAPANVLTSLQTSRRSSEFFVESAYEADKNDSTATQWWQQ